MDNCIFCKIISGELPSYKIYEDEYTLAFLDVAKDIDGHTLVVPKKHCRNVLDADDETLAHAAKTIKTVSNHYISLGYDGINILNANESCAQQTVFHLHFHVIPRKNDDGIDAWPKLECAKHELEDMWNKLKMF